MLQNPSMLRTTMKKYGDLQSLNGYTPQQRGQEFNFLISEMFEAWGIKAKSNILGSGEIDVGFELDGKRFILEAKWEKDPVDTGAIAKLQKRLRQRLKGTIGLFLSISGYTQEALTDIKEGEQLSIILLERDHFEAMLSGFVPPSELINGCISQASFPGDPNPNLLSIFETPQVGKQDIQFDFPTEIKTLIRSSVDNFRADIVLSNLPFGLSGIATLEVGKILVTLQDGIFVVDLSKKSIDIWFPVPECSRNPLNNPDGYVYIVRKSGVGRMKAGKFSIIGGGFTGNVCLFQGFEGEVYAFSNGSIVLSSDESMPLIAKLGNSIGDQTIYNLEYPISNGTNVAMVDEDMILVVGNAGVRNYSLDNGIQKAITHLTNPMGLVKISDAQFVVASGEVELTKIDFETNSCEQIATFNLQGAVSELTKGWDKNSGFLFSHYSSKQELEE